MTRRVKLVLAIGAIVVAFFSVLLIVRYNTVGPSSLPAQTAHDEARVETAERAALEAKLRRDLPDSHIDGIYARSVRVEQFHRIAPHDLRENTTDEDAAALAIIRDDWTTVYRTFHPNAPNPDLSYSVNRSSHSRLPICAPM